VRYALIGDVHANLPALEAVLADLAAREPDVVYHLGDLVGYAPWPNQVVERVRSLGIAGIAGNYDSMIATGYDASGQDESARGIFEWTARETSEESRRFLASLPFLLTARPLGGHAAGPSLTMVHGTPALNTTAWWPHLADELHLEMAGKVGAEVGDVVACGHIHRPWYREIGGVHFVGIGSVGRPKDGDWRACYALVELAASGVRVEFVRVEYDVERAARAIRESPLPDHLADFLRTAGAAGSA
jgi:predicted phosphodiesterase